MMTDTGVLMDGTTAIAHFADAGRSLIATTNLLLVARWVHLSAVNELDDWTSEVPVPVDPSLPLHDVLLAFAKTQLPEECGGIATDDPRSMPSNNPLVTRESQFFDHSWSTVTCWTPGVVSLLISSWNYSGGAHTNGSSSAITWYCCPDGKTWRRAELTDLFGPDGAWRQRIIDAVIADLIRQHAGWFEDARYIPVRPAASTMLRCWNVAGDGLVITFEAGEAGARCQGTLTARIPWASLPPMVSTFPMAGIMEKPQHQ
jgi:hypothetical protein